MSESIKTRSTSLVTAVCEDVILRDGDRIRLVFRPTLVDNPKNSAHAVRGLFVYQKKSVKDAWQDYRSLDLNKLVKDQYFQLDLSSEEVFKLIGNLRNCYHLVQQHGIVLGDNEFIITPSNISSVVKDLVDKPETLEKLLKTGGEDFVVSALKWLSTFDEKGLIDKLVTIDKERLSNLQTSLSLSALKKALATWTVNANNKDEEFWQKQLSENPWVISQVFSAPIILFQDKAYVGGKQFDNKGGNLIDYLYKNKITHNLVYIEIKTPVSSLVGLKYRDNVYPPSSDVSGGVTQILNYQNEAQTDWYKLSKDNPELQNLCPKGLLIVGNTKSLDDRTKRRSFELFRSNLRNVEVITFDELFEKIRTLISLLEKGS